ncbi:TSN5 protein, partial [Polypterus senegalus]
MISSKFAQQASCGRQEQSLDVVQDTSSNPPSSEEDKIETAGQEVVSPELYVKHPLQNRSVTCGCSALATPPAHFCQLGDRRTPDVVGTVLKCKHNAFDDYSDDVCGAVVNIRTKGDKIAIWTKDYENKDAVTHIGTPSGCFGDPRDQPYRDHLHLSLFSDIVRWAQLLGIAFLGIGLWAWNEKGVLSNISSITDLGGFDPVWLFLVVGGVMFILGFAGCIGALRENTFLLKFFSVFLGIIFFLELTAGVLAFVFKDWIKDQLNFFINNNIRAYRDDIDLQNLIDFTQEYWQCCGAFGADDWNLNIYFNCTDANPSRERCGVPFSCCTKDPAEDVINTQCGYDVRAKTDSEQHNYIHTKGCVPQFEKWLQDNLTVVAGIFIGIALLQLAYLILSDPLALDVTAIDCKRENVYLSDEESRESEPETEEEEEEEEFEEGELTDSVSELDEKETEEQMEPADNGDAAVDKGVLAEAGDAPVDEPSVPGEGASVLTEGRTAGTEEALTGQAAEVCSDKNVTLLQDEGGCNDTAGDDPSSPSGAALPTNNETNSDMPTVDTTEGNLELCLGTEQNTSSSSKKEIKESSSE